MVFVKNFVNDFYRVILHERLLVLTHIDIDSICAVRILQSLFTCDNIMHTIVPISNYSELQKTFNDHIEGFKYVLMINCGGSVDIVELLQPELGVVFFILDSHRPLTVENIYNAEQTRILIKQENIDSQIPDYEQVFRDESDSESDGGFDSDGEPKRKRFDEKALEKRDSKRKWEENRIEVLRNYMATSYIGGCSALAVYDISYNMNKDTAEQLWWAIIAVTSQYIHHYVDYYHYFENVGVLQNHVSRVERRDDTGEADYSINCLKLTFDTDMRIELYKHWNLYDSMFNSLYTVSHFKTWTARGKNRLHEFLADMGLPLSQCKQTYSSMDASLRSRVNDLFNEHCNKFHMEVTSLFMPTFFAKFGYRNTISAIDAVHACSATLNNVFVCKDPSHNFSKTLDLLKRSQIEDFVSTIQLSIKSQLSLLSQVSFLLSTNAVFPMTSFLYTVLSQPLTDSATDPLRTAFGLEKLAHYLQQIWLNSEKCRKESHRNLPLIMLCPLTCHQLETEDVVDKSLVVGIPPLETTESDNGRNFLGEVFQHIAESAEININQDRIERHVIEIETADQEIFLESLLDVLQ